MLKGIFNICFLIYIFLPNLPMGALLCEALENLPLWLNLCLKFTARLKDLTILYLYVWGTEMR
jgi:hypothetical protein